MDQLLVVGGAEHRDRSGVGRLGQQRAEASGRAGPGRAGQCSTICSAKVRHRSCGSLPTIVTSGVPLSRSRSTARRDGRLGKTISPLQVVVELDPRSGRARSRRTPRDRWWANGSASCCSPMKRPAGAGRVAHIAPDLEGHEDDGRNRAPDGPSNGRDRGPPVPGPLAALADGPRAGSMACSKTRLPPGRGAGGSRAVYGLAMSDRSPGRRGHRGHRG